MSKNEDGYDVEHTYVDKVEDGEDSYYLTGGHGWTLSVGKSECGDLVPALGDSLTVFTKGFSEVVGLIIAGTQVRYKTPAQVDRERIDWLIGYNQDKLDRLRENYDSWQEQVEALHPTLKARIRRFESKPNVVNAKFEFWLHDGGYELMALKGADALLKAAEVNGGQDWLKYWWSLNTAEHNYNYKKQAELVPEFGDGHSGNTAGAAYSLALGIMTGSYTE